MRTYHDYLAARGYQRQIIEPTTKRPGDLVLHSKGVERVRWDRSRRVAVG